MRILIENLTVEEDRKVREIALRTGESFQVIIKRLRSNQKSMGDY